jgi:hypothetical protein
MILTPAARAIAEQAHAGQLDPAGEPLLAHVSRVALAAPPGARGIAWLHEVLECTSLREDALLASGLSKEELRALRLLVRPPAERSEPSYLGHIAHIARSSGWAGMLARQVKWSDLLDRLGHPCRRPDGWCPPYARGLAMLAQVQPHILARHDGIEAAGAPLVAIR